MSSVPDDLALKLEWYDVRDLFLGEEGKAQDVGHALEMAAVCRHPDAEWLTEIFAGQDVTTPDEARDATFSFSRETTTLERYALLRCSQVL